MYCVPYAENPSGGRIISENSKGFSYYMSEVPLGRDLLTYFHSKTIYGKQIKQRNRTCVQKLHMGSKHVGPS